MRLKPEQLERELRSPEGCWLVSGDEPLLVGEAADAIRAAARREGYSDREVFFLDARADWGPVLESGQSLSLFADRRLLELRLASARLGVSGGQSLARLVESPPPDTVLLILAPRLERAVQSSPWVKAVERQGRWLAVWPIEADALPGWIRARAAAAGLKLSAGAVQALAQRVEGNLLAAGQELEKILLLRGPGELDADELIELVVGQARYDASALCDAALAANAAQALRIVQGLRQEGAELPLILWALAGAVRSVIAQRQRRSAPPAFGPGAQRRMQLVQQAERRLAGRSLVPLLRQAARVDRCIKGAEAGDPWDELTRLVTSLAGIDFPSTGLPA